MAQYQRKAETVEATVWDGKASASVRLFSEAPAELVCELCGELLTAHGVLQPTAVQYGIQATRICPGDYIVDNPQAPGKVLVQHKSTFDAAWEPTVQA